jgi:Skp family chaperone for outer membrane proteins
MKIRNIGLAAAFFTGLSSMAGAAMAQTKVYIVNEAKIFQDSKLGKALNQALTEEANAAVDKLGLKDLKSQVDTEAAALKPQTQSLTKEALAANPTLKARVDAYNKKAGDLVQRSSALDQGVQEQRSANQMRFNYVMVGAIETVGKEVGADVVLSYGAAFYNKDSIDISSKVVARLDATVPTLEALKAALPQPPVQPAAPATAPKPGGGR